MTSAGLPLVAAGQTSAAAAATADDSVAFRVGPNHDGTQVDPTLNPPLTERWTAFHGRVVQTPLIAGNRVFTVVTNEVNESGGGTPGAVLYGYDLASGTQLWPGVELGGSSGFDQAAYDGGRIFVAGGGGDVRAIDPVTGGTVWFTQLPGQMLHLAPPTALNGTLYATGAGFGGTLYAINEADGSIRWTAPINNGDYSSPAVDGSTVYVSSACDEAYAFDVSTGAQRWHFDQGCSSGGTGSSPVLHDGSLYLRDTGLTTNPILDAVTGQPTGTFSSWSPPTFVQSLMIGMTYDWASIRATNLSGGTTAWTFSDSGKALMPPIVVNSTVYTVSWDFSNGSDSTLFAIDGSTGNVVWSMTLHAMQPVQFVDGGTQSYTMAAGDGSLAIPLGTQLAIFGTGAAVSPGRAPQAAPSLPPLHTGASTGNQVAFQVDGIHSGGQVNDSTVPPLTKRWSLPLGAAAHPLIIGGHAYINGQDCLLATGACTGTRIAGLNFSYDAGRIFGAGNSGDVYAYDISTNAVVWSRQLPTGPGFGSEPAAHNGIVYIAAPGGASGGGGMVYALNASDGSTRWTAPVINGNLSSPVASDTGVYVSFGCGQVYDFDPSTGNVLWHHAGLCQSNMGRTPSLYRGRLYVRDNVTGNLIFDAATGKVLGTFSATVAPAFYGSMGIFLNKNVLRAVDLDTGFLVWTYQATGPPPNQPFDDLNFPPVADNGYVYDIGINDVLIAVDIRTGKPVWFDNSVAPDGTQFADEAQPAPLRGIAVGGGYVLVPQGKTLNAFSSSTAPSPPTPHPSRQPAPAAPAAPHQSRPGAPGATPSPLPSQQGAPAVSPSPQPSRHGAPAVSPSPHESLQGAMAPEEVTTFQIDAAHDGAQVAGALTSPLQPTASVDFMGPLSYPVVVDGKVWFTAPTNTEVGGVILYALDLKTGRPALLPYVFYPGTEPGTTGEEHLTYDNGKIYALESDGLLRTFDSTTGGFLWQVNLRQYIVAFGTTPQFGYTAPLTVSNGTLYVVGGGNGSSILALNSADGSLRWFADTLSDAPAVAVTSTGVYHSGSSGSCTTANDHDPQTGKLMWSATVPGCAPVSPGEGTTPAAYGGRVYIRGLSGLPITIFDAQSGAQQGTIDADEGPAFAGQTALVVKGGALQARDLTTNALLWSFGGDGHLSTAPVVENGTAYVGSLAGNLYGVDVTSGSLTWTAATGIGYLPPENYPTQTYPVTGLAAGQGALVAPAHHRLSIFESSGVTPTPSPALSGSAQAPAAHHRTASASPSIAPEASSAPGSIRDALPYAARTIVDRLRSLFS